MPKISTLKQIYERLNCQEKTVNGVCWFECNTNADKAVVIFHGVTGGKIDMAPLAERYVNFGYAVYAIDLPGHGGSLRPKFESYDDLADWLNYTLEQIGRFPDVIISNSFSSSILYHALRTNKIPDNTKIIMACPTPDTTILADALQKISNNLPENFSWSVYNSRPIRGVRVAVALKTRQKAAWNWLIESERYKKDNLTLRDSDILTTLLYENNPYVHGIALEYQKRITLIIGGKDNVAPPKTASIMHELLPEARIISVPAAGHILHFEALEAYPEP